LAGIIVTIVAMSLAIDALNPDRAVPISPVIVYEPRPVIEQVDPKELARHLLTKKDFRCFTKLMGKESAWEDKKNPHSSASGVGQLLDSSYHNLGMKRSKAKVAQTVAALAYIGRHYGSGGPCKAWQTFLKRGHY
jgi:hypothetical protein